MSLTFPPYSFVQDGAITYPGCYADQAACLPTSSAQHIAFQVTAPIADTFFIDNIFAPRYLAAVPVDFDCTPRSYNYDSAGEQIVLPGNRASHILNHLPLVGAPAFHINDDLTSTTLWFDSMNTDYASCTTSNNMIALPVGTCFKFVVITDIYTDGYVSSRSYYGCTNCFTVTDATECYTSVLSYANPDDTFGFDYEEAPAGYANIIELPLYLRDPKMENDQKVYTRSDGSIMKIYERKEEVYQLETDLMPYMWHKALDIALSHDSVTIANTNAASFDPLNTATQFVKKDAYEIEYNKAPLSALGKGKCKLSNADAVNLINNNCA